MNETSHTSNARSRSRSPRRTPAASVFGLLLATLAFGGCAIVQSTPESAKTARNGIAYRLPKALVPVELVETGTDLRLRVLTPEMIGDPRHGYLLGVPASGVSSDKTTVEVDSKTGLLKKVDASSTDESLNVLKTIIVTRTGGRRAELGGGGAEEVLFRADLDPDAAFDRRAERANRCTLARMEQVVVGRQKAAAASAASAASAPQSTVVAPAALGRITVRFRIDGVEPMPAGEGDPCSTSTAAPKAEDAADTAAAKAADDIAANAADCTAGICHRGLRPFRIELGTNGRIERETTLMLPNGGLPVALPLTRAPFVTTKHIVEFDAGMVKSHALDRPSSALALVKWPLDVYRAVLAATSELITLRIGANTDEVKLRESELKTEQEIDRLRHELDAFRAGTSKGEMASLDVSAGPSGVVMNMVLGAGPSAAKRAGDGGAAKTNPALQPTPNASPGAGQPASPGAIK